MNKHKILLLDYKLGNHQSVSNALEFLGYNFQISNNPKDIAEASVYILPGVGAFNEAMKNLYQLNLIKPLEEQVLKKKKPILGICLGMQILAEDSEENGFYQGLGWIKGHVVKIKAKSGLRVPHVGWNNIKINQTQPLFTNITEHTEQADFYFDHSYHFSCNTQNVAATVDYGTTINAAVQQDNIFGVQFHPEKSQNNGLRLFRNFFQYYKIS